MRRSPAPRSPRRCPTAHDLVTCGQKWLRAFTPFFTPDERREAGCERRLFLGQTGYRDNLILRRCAALDRFGARLLDANRTIGRPDSLTMIFGRRVTTHHRGKLQPSIHDYHSPNPVIRSHSGHGFVKQYVRDHLLLRAEPATHDVGDDGVRRALEHLPALRSTLAGIVDAFFDVQQDTLQTPVDRGQIAVSLQERQTRLEPRTVPPELHPHVPCAVVDVGGRSVKAALLESVPVAPARSRPRGSAHGVRRRRRGGPMP